MPSGSRPPSGHESQPRSQVAFHGLPMFTRYLDALVNSGADLIYRGVPQSLDYYDSLYTILSPATYLTVLYDILNSLPFVLLPVISPELLCQALASDRSSSSLTSLLQQISALREYERFEVHGVDLYQTELRAAFECDDYTFNVPKNVPFPLVIKRLLPGEPAYTPQFVDDALVFSPSLKRNVRIPFIYHNRASTMEFVRLKSSTHELVHVIQRVFRKRRVPAYRYLENGTARYRNPEAYVRVGVEDELEVQKVLVASGYTFALNPITFHQRSVLTNLRQVYGDEAIQIVRSAIERIDFEKYSGLYEGDLRGEIMRSLLEVA